MNDQNAQPMQDNSYVDNYQPPMSTQDPGTDTPQNLDSQNVFYLLGVHEGKVEEQEAFLDELQQVIWEDFLESDVRLLVTQEEYAQLEEIMAKTDLSDEDRQEEMVVFLEKLVPDLEEIMLEKAISLKADMFKERIAGLKEFFASDANSLGQVSKAEELMNQDKWYDAATLLNQLG